MKRLVLLSGWGTGPAVWGPVVRRLRDLEVQCLPWWECLDGGLAPYVAEDVLLGGWSLGGVLALKAATERPVAGLVLVSSTARFLADAGYEGADARALRAMRMRLGAGPEEALADFAARCMAPMRDDRFGARFVTEAAAMGVERLAAGLRCLAETDLRARLAAVSAPALVLHGERDQVIPLASARALAAGLTRARLVAMPDAPHALLEMHAATVAEEVESFVHGQIA